MVSALRKLPRRARQKGGFVHSLKEEIAPGDMVLVDQYIDRTVQRPATFFEKGIVAHVGFGTALTRPKCITVSTLRCVYANGSVVRLKASRCCSQGTQCARFFE
jgi:5'-methylthioadenosine phosphorylase